MHWSVHVTVNWSDHGSEDRSVYRLVKLCATPWGSPWDFPMAWDRTKDSVLSNPR